jgi:ketosteroid isomerase-like protein
VAEDFESVVEDYHRATHEITKGNPEAYKPLFSRRDEVVLANPFGPPVRGWRSVSATLDHASRRLRDGDLVGFENLTTVITPDLAYIVEIESFQARVDGADEKSPLTVRVTTIFRREDGSWKVVLRQADPTVAPRPPGSVFPAD